MSGSIIVLSSTVGSYLRIHGQFLLSILTLGPSLVGVMPFLLTRRSLNCFTKPFPSDGRELFAILYSLKSLKSLIQGKVVKLYTDSKNASIIASKGSTALGLQRHALEIFQFCAINNVSIEFEWFQRSLNEYADSLSKVIDFDDWGVSTDFFVYVSSLFDRCASPDSAKCARFYFKFWCPSVVGVDAFS